MKTVLLPLLMLGALCAAQIPVTNTGNAKSTAACSPANTGSQNRFVINCGIGKQQGEQMIKILNTVLANQLNPDAVMEKLDEILKNENVNRAVITYDCAGRWFRRSPGFNAMEEVSTGGTSTDFDDMVHLANRQQTLELITKCEGLLVAKPEWETPRLLCSVGYYRKGDIAKAKEFLKTYEARIGPAYEEQHCQAIQQDLHRLMP